MISGNGSTLQSILDGAGNYDVTVVISSRADAYGILRARRAGVPVHVLPNELRKKENKARAEAWMIQVLKSYRVQAVFLAGFMRILSEDFINTFEDTLFNVHPSLLPKYRGAHGFEDAVTAGDQYAGITIHHVVPEVDSGAFVLQRKFEIPSHREMNKSRLWLSLNEQNSIRASLQRIIWRKQLMSQS